ncbi:H+/Cl- antiporter ClcA [Chitinophaga dinghuensis]|uniref:H+/Cl-antiporter ClcA n=1 Tax=Chitinophaga dinghuensis TaxID=1539050 RepID=A0A327VNI2_9BACT|nr:chloride channel protein [Chitinophaga dinghuensis]RAJ75098.1 H+/Cl- antiporter ClcA [Chitinophaga dinghuensis]
MKHKNRKPAVFIAPSLDKSAYDQKKMTGDKTVSGRLFYLSLQAIINAVIIGVIAKGLVGLINLITNISFYGKFSFGEASPAHNQLGLWVIIIPVIGGLIIGVMARLGSAAIRGHGIPEAMEQVLTNESRIKPVITILKPLSAAISIGTGGPFGAEGPIISTGGAFGSFAGQIMHISPNERKIMLTAGATAGMAAIFGTPVAAVLLAIELLLFEFSPRTIIPVALACATGAAMHILMFGSGPVFPMPAFPAPDAQALAWYVLGGAIIGVLAAFVSKSIYLIEDLFEKLPIHWMWWPAIGAIVIGVTGYFAPYTLGVGYNNITSLLSGQLPLAMVLGLCFMKYISWSISLGSGTSGGTLAPLMTIGGASGVLFGLIVLHFFPESHINLSVCALIGMAAMFAGAARALLTAVVFAFEATMQPHGLLPLLGACTASYFVSFFLMKGSIMTEKIERRGVAAPNSYEPDILQRLKVADIMETMPEPVGAINTSVFVYPDAPLSNAVDLISLHKLDILPVLNPADNTLSGLLTPARILDAYSNSRNAAEQYQQVFSIRRRRNRLLIRSRHLFSR